MKIADSPSRADMERFGHNPVALNEGRGCETGKWAKRARSERNVSVGTRTDQKQNDRKLGSIDMESIDVCVEKVIPRFALRVIDMTIFTDSKLPAKANKAA